MLKYLLNYFDSRNRVTSQGLVTVYQTLRDTTSQSAPYYQYTRIRTKNYSYVGMDKATAARCVKAMLEKYTRRYRMWRFVNGYWRQILTQDGLYTDLVASVVPTKGVGSMWDVQVQVNETAIIYMAHPPESLDVAFDGYLGEWDYDED